MNAISREAGVTQIRLRRDGEAPLRFLGQQIARHDGHAPGATLWHNLALYRGAAGDYAIQIVAWIEAGPACCHAERAETLDAALTWLETYDPSVDVCPGITTAVLGFDDPAVSPACLAMQAASLRCIHHDVERRYRIGVGAFLMRLGDQEI